MRNAIRQAFESQSAWPGLLKIIQKLNGKGFKALLAGGAVRDALLGRPIHDFDIATNAKPEDVEALFKQTIMIGKDFGVAMVIQDGHQFEVTSFRSDEAYVDGRRPTGIIFSTPQQDAERRDFTVNGLFFDLTSNEVIDYVDGISDLEKRCLRAIGEPDERFQEDHLRLLRAVRFQAQLNFEMDEKTWQSLKRHQHLISSVSKERITDELRRLSLAENSVRGWVQFNRLDWQKLILGINEPLPKLWRSKAPMPLEMALAFFEWSTDISPKVPLLILSNDEKSRWQKMVKALREMSDACELLPVLKVLNEFWGPLLCHNFLALEKASRQNQIRLIKAMAHFANIMGKDGNLPKSFFNGNDLIELGFSKGPKLGDKLEELYRYQILEGLTKEQILERLKIEPNV